MHHVNRVGDRSGHPIPILDTQLFQDTYVTPRRLSAPSILLYLVCSRIPAVAQSDLSFDTLYASNKAVCDSKSSLPLKSAALADEPSQCMCSS